MIVATIAPPHHLFAMLLVQRLELLPLIGGQHLPDVEKHVRVGLFELSAGLGDLVDLPEHLRLIGLVGFDHGTHHDLLLLEVGVQIHQLEAVLLENVVHLLFLVIGEVDSLSDFGVIPPAAEVLVVKGVLHRRRPETVLTGTSGSAGPGSLGKAQAACSQAEKCCNKIPTSAMHVFSPCFDSWMPVGWSDRRAAPGHPAHPGSNRCRSGSSIPYRRRWRRAGWV